MVKNIGIYVHVPFCVKKCNYCDFYSVTWNKEKELNFINAILNEIKSYKNYQYNVDTIFFGGGTPTIVKPSNLGLIINEIKNTFTIDENCEISMEANPNTLTSENLLEYKQIGINRLSIGIQSLNDEILKKIGRLHDSQEALDAIKKAKQNGFDNINADIMFNIPGQTTLDIENTIQKIIDHEVKHISFYSLKLEQGTPMYDMEKSNKIIMPDEDVEREMYYAGRSIMKKNNLMQYEISNFAFKGFECRHNLKYWNQDEYIGFGPSSHSFLNNERFSNVSNITEYIDNALKGDYNRIVHEKLDHDGLMFEYIMLRLRLNEGLDTEIFQKKFNVDFYEKYSKQIKYLKDNKLIECENNNIKLTNMGMDVSNHVFEKFMVD
jgi:oxygen-independent coproporphyrinogen-3 oxidase